jgi:hypothetical protein
MTKDLGRCPKCLSKLFRMWGEMWDWDHAVCPSRDCDYDVELDEMTCTEPDGSVVVIPKPRDDE